MDESVGRQQPTINAGNPAGGTDTTGLPLDTDQRRAPRVGLCDLGAFEYGSTPPDEIFSDGFEGGSVYSWSLVSP